MLHRVFALSALGVALSAALLQAQPNLFVLPGAGSPSTFSEAFNAVTTTNPITVNIFRTFTSGAGAFAIIPNSNGSAVFIVASTPVNSVTSTNETFLSTNLVANLSPAPTQAVLTPNGELLAVAAGTVYLFNPVSGASLAANGVSQGTGINTIGVASSLDSTSIFALGTNSSGTGQLNSISTSSDAVSGTLALTESATAVSVGPNGLVYVSMPSQILEVNPSTLQPTYGGQIAVTGTPGPLVFTPDGQYALGISQSGNLLVASLATHTATAPNIGVTGIKSLQVIGLDTVLALTDVGLVYPITISSSPLSVSVGSSLLLPGVGTSGVIAVAATNDVPTTTHSTVQVAYLVSETNVYQYIPSSESVLTPFPVASNVIPGALVYAPAASELAPASIVPHGANQTILPGTTSEPLVAQVLDENNHPVSGVFVQFQANNGATLSSGSGVTGSNGYAVTYVKASAATGVITVTASVLGSLATPANFSINVSSSAQGTGAPTLTIISGQGEVMLQSTNTDFGPPFAPLEVLAADASGNPIPNLPVTFTVSTDGGTLFVNGVGGSTQTVNTNSAGVALVEFESTAVPPNATAAGFFQPTITASASNTQSVTFYNTTAIEYPNITQLQQPPDPLIGQEGTTLPDVISIRVTSGNTGIPNVSLILADTDPNPNLYPSAQCDAPGGVVLTNANGIATCNVTFGPRVGNGSFLALYGYTEAHLGGPTPFTVIAGAPATVQITQGNNQSGTPGQTLPLALRIHVTDSGGNVVTGAPVTWQVVTAGTVTLSNIIGATDESGDSSALATLGSIGGAAQVTATSGGVSVTFNLTVNIPTAALQKVSGDQQTTTINTAFALPLVVQAVNSSGNPVAGAQVTFAVTAGSATLGSASAVTSSTGQASATVTAGATAGSITVTATSSTLNVSFTLTSLLPGPQNITIVNGASFDPNTGISPGSIATIEGMGILPGVSGVVVAPVTNGQYPTTFSGVTVTFNGTPAPIYYVDNSNGSNQISVQVPFEVQPGPSVALEISVANEGSSTVMVPVKPLAPGVFTSVYDGKTYAVAVRPDGSQVSPTNPAQQGETIQLYITGLGQATPAIATNAAGVADQTIVSHLVVGLNNSGVPLVSAVYGPGLIGIYIVILQVPEHTQTGPYQPIGVIAYDSAKNAYYAQPTYIPIQ
jgi:uncharacterized protein (TIGR03437 family)